MTTETTPIPTPSPAQPVPPSPKRPTWQANPWRLFTGLLVVLFGLSLLGQQFGWNWIAPEAVWRLWPVFIILAGVSLIVRGKATAAAIGALVVVMVAGAVMVMSRSAWSTATRTQSISVPREAGVTAGQVNVRLGAAKVTINGGATDFIQSTFETNDDNLRVKPTLEGTTQRVEIDRPAERSWIFWGRKSELTMRVPNDVPLDVRVDSGAADLDLDFTGVQATSVDIDAGASSIDLTLDDIVSRSQVTIDSGAASMTIALPRTAGVRVSLDGGALSKNMPPELKKISEDMYETDGFATAEKQIVISIDAGASSITMHLI